MELKPVVHYNGSLNFDAANTLRNIITLIKCQYWGILLPLICVFTLCSFVLFSVAGKTLNPIYLFAEFILATVAFLVSRYLYNRVASVVTRIGSRICITDDMVSVIPFTFNIFFVKLNSEDRFEFKINELKIRKTDNPLKFTRSLNNRVFEIHEHEKEVYIVFDYFDETLKEKLNGNFG